ncbi:MAG: hypothetical protein ACK559_21120, partial [bacterium]
FASVRVPCLPSYNFPDYVHPEPFHPSKDVAAVRNFLLSEFRQLPEVGHCALSDFLFGLG